VPGFQSFIMEQTHDSLSKELIFGFLGPDEVGIFGNLFDEDAAAIVQDQMREDPSSDFDFWGAGGNSVSSSLVTTHPNPHLALLESNVESNSRTANPQWDSPKSLDPQLTVLKSQAKVPSSQIVTSSRPAVIIDEGSFQPASVSLQVPPDHAVVHPQFLVPDAPMTGAAQWTHQCVPDWQTETDIPGHPAELDTYHPQPTLSPVDSLPSGVVQSYISGPHGPGNLHSVASSDGPLSTTFEIGNQLLDQSELPPNDDRSQQDPFPLYDLGQPDFSDIHWNFTAPLDLQLDNTPFPADFPAAPIGVFNLDSSAAFAPNHVPVSASQVPPPTSDPELELSTPDLMLVDITQEISELPLDGLDISVTEDFPSIPSQAFFPTNSITASGD
jgi:hypothetical protein